MRFLLSLARTHASFDDPHPVSRAGLVPVMALALRAGLAEHVRPMWQLEAVNRRLPTKLDSR